MNYEFTSLGDTALTVRLGVDGDDTRAKINTLARLLAERPLPGIVELVTGFATLTIFYDPVRLSKLSSFASNDLPNHTGSFDGLCSLLQPLIVNLKADSLDQSRLIEIPACYDVEFAPDIDLVARHNNLTVEDVIGLHAGGDYLVHMIGFAPGFPYLGGLSPRLSTPRHRTPRTHVPAGAIGIGGDQTGIYSIDSPGGWQLIGRTPVALFLPHATPPSLLQAGDRVRFRRINVEEFNRWSLASNTPFVAHGEQ